MDTEERRDIACGQSEGNGFIGGQHELFDQFMGHVAFSPDHVGNLPCIIYEYFRLRYGKPDAATVHACFFKYLCQLRHIIKILSDVAVAFAKIGVTVHKDFFDCSVGQPVLADNDAPGKFLGNSLAVPVKFQNSGKGWPGLIGHQAAEIVGKAFRQHWHNAVREIDACPPFISLAVKG